MSETSDRDDAPMLNVIGERIALGPLRRELVPHYHRWLNTFSHGRNFDDTPEPWTFERSLALFEKRARQSETTITFTIYEYPSLRAVGYTLLDDISFRHRSAEFAIHIGEDDAQGRGYGTETARLMLDLAFTSLGLHSVYLTVAEYNLAGLHAYRHAGFRECGRRRQAWWMGSRFWDEILMDCLASEHTSQARIAPERPREPQR